MNNLFTTPILAIIFNRPEKVRALIRALAEVKPTRLYVAADGPRRNVVSDIKACAEARAALDAIDWECEIVTRFSEENAGCRYGITDAIDWFFENVEEGIILEDDCIPHPTFFSFCNELLEYYRNNNEVMHISGNNFQAREIHGDGSYYFSKYTHNWGWATWRRAWKHYHTALDSFAEFDQKNKILTIPISQPAQKFWIKNFRYTIKNSDSWDSLWQYAVWSQNGLAILPNKNLVSNIGFGTGATHTHSPTNQANMAVSPIRQIIHPSQRVLSEAADEYTYQTIFYTPLWRRIVLKIKKILKL